MKPCTDAAGKVREFHVSGGVHQGSALSPLHIILVKDIATRELQKPMSWTLLYADDVMFARENEGEIELQTQAWSDGLARFGTRLNVRKAGI